MCPLWKKTGDWVTQDLEKAEKLWLFSSVFPIKSLSLPAQDTEGKGREREINCPVQDWV